MEISKRRKKVPLENYIRAGAYYRLWKAISTRAICEISVITQSKKASDKLVKASRCVDRIETEISLEECLAQDHPELNDADFCSVFYGDIPDNLSQYSEMETKIYKAMNEIINELFKKGDT